MLTSHPRAQQKSLRENSLERIIKTPDGSATANAAVVQRFDFAVALTLLRKTITVCKTKRL